MYMDPVREKMLKGLAQAADQQPWRCVECGEAVSHVNPRPCACIRAAQARVAAPAR